MKMGTYFGAPRAPIAGVLASQMFSSTIASPGRVPDASFATKVEGARNRAVLVKAMAVKRRLGLSVTGVVQKVLGELAVPMVNLTEVAARTADSARGVRMFYSTMNPLNFGAGALRGLLPGAAAA